MIMTCLSKKKQKKKKSPPKYLVLKQVKSTKADEQEKTIVQ